MLHNANICRAWDMNRMASSCMMYWWSELALPRQVAPSRDAWSVGQKRLTCYIAYVHMDSKIGCLVVTALCNHSGDTERRLLQLMMVFLNF
jgi:hypothetical protein